MAGPRVVRGSVSIDECPACGASHIVSISQALGGPLTFRCPTHSVAVNMDTNEVMGEIAVEPETEVEEADNAETVVEEASIETETAPETTSEATGDSVRVEPLPQGELLPEATVTVTATEDMTVTEVTVGISDDGEAPEGVPA